MIENSDIPISNLELLLPQDIDVYQNTLAEKNVPPMTLDQLIDEQADIHPDRIANDGSIKYQLEWKPFVEYLKQSGGHPIKIVNTEQFMNLFKDDSLSDKQKYALELMVPLLEETAENSLSIPTCQDTQRFLQEVDVVCELPNAKFVSNLIDYGS